jgi:hypothetical protein
MQSREPQYAWRFSLAYNVRKNTCGELAALLYRSAPQLSTAMHPNFQPVKVMTSDGAWRHGYACIRPRRRFRSEVVSRTDPCLWVAVPGKLRKFHMTFNVKQLRDALKQGRLEVSHSTRHAAKRAPSTCTSPLTGKQLISW